MLDPAFDDARIIVFCKAPIPGNVKTRLVSLLGEHGAMELHAELATRTIQVVLRARLARLELWCDPDPCHEFFRAFGQDSIDSYAQYGVDLGERMFNALADSLARPGVERVILVGTDCPQIDTDYLQGALDDLVDHDAVLGPAEDGGYGLIGLRRANMDLFREIAWGGSSVCESTCRKLNALQINFALRPLLWDIDRPEDVLRYREMRTASDRKLDNR